MMTAVAKGLSPMTDTLWDAVKDKRVSLGVTLSTVVVALWFSLWVDQRFMTLAEANELGDEKHAPLVEADERLEQKVDGNTRLLQSHINRFNDYTRAESIKEIQALINDTNDKLFELQRFPNDERRQAQEVELRHRLAEYELRKECILRGDTSCD